jgi:hypothetical protein
MGGGGSEGPAYYSSVIITEDKVDDPSILRSVYSSYIFNRTLVWPDAYKTGISRTEAEDDEIAAWIFSCYFPASFSEHKACADEAPGHKWSDAMWDVRREYGQDYTDGLMCYTVKTWKGVPAKYVNDFDKFFRYRIAGGESVKDNGQRDREIDAIFKRVLCYPLAAFALRVLAQRAFCAIEIFLRAAADNLLTPFLAPRFAPFSNASMRCSIFATSVISE